MVMNLRVALSLLAFVSVIETSAQQAFDRFFEPKSLRVDFALSGNRDTQSAAIEQIREEPVWGGPKVNLVDSSYYGGYYINVYDKATNALIYSRGFNTLFEEWRTTEQAGNETQSWVNSMSVPFPKNEVVIEITARDKKDMRFKTLLKQELDPKSIFIDRSPLKNNKVYKIVYNGDPAEKVDVVFIAEGYTEAEQAKFEADARRFAEALLKTSPFDKHKEDFNIWAVGLVSEESGTDFSGKGIFKNTALNSGFYTFGVDRYLTTKDTKGMKDAVWNVPNDALFILINTEVYGGGGMYNYYACGSADNKLTAEVFVHELGHSFAGLTDEYFTSEVAYDDDFYIQGVEPWEPNITALVDFDSKWKNMLPKKTPVPTPLTDKYRNGVGVFEGAGYKAKGLYRPYDHCMMRDLAPFCPVCEAAILKMIDFVCGKSDK
jgi:hypothetical protein